MSSERLIELENEGRMGLIGVWVFGERQDWVCNQGEVWTCSLEVANGKP